MTHSLRAQNMLLICKNKLEELKKIYPRLNSYEIKITHRKEILGSTKFVKKIILLNYNLLDLGDFSQIKNTFYHEISHALDLTIDNYLNKRGGAHGITWQAYARKLNVKIEDSGILFDYKDLKPWDKCYADHTKKTKNRLRWINKFYFSDLLNNKS
jgi:hypothetical protein